MSIGIAVVLGLIATIACTVLLYIFVLSKDKGSKQTNKFLLGLRDYFQFKRLYVEDILKFLFTVLSVACVCIGFFLLFSGYDSYWDGYKSFFFPGLMTMILGPIVLRLFYELMMLTILMVRNTMEINHKLDKLLPKEAPAAPAAPVAPAAPAAPVAPAEAPQE